MMCGWVMQEEQSYPGNTQTGLRTPNHSGNIHGRILARKIYRHLSITYWPRHASANWPILAFPKVQPKRKFVFSNLQYFWHWQTPHWIGTTAFLALTSTRPEFNAKINHAHLMAPVAFLKDSGDKFYKTMSSNYPQLRMICHDLNIFRITLDQIDILKKIEMLCHRMYSKSKSDCSYFNWFVGYDGVNPVNWNRVT